MGEEGQDGGLEANYGAGGRAEAGDETRGCLGAAQLPQFLQSHYSRMQRPRPQARPNWPQPPCTAALPHGRAPCQPKPFRLPLPAHAGTNDIFVSVLLRTLPFKKAIPPAKLCFNYSHVLFKINMIYPFFFAPSPPCPAAPPGRWWCLAPAAGCLRQREQQMT